jgi:hypothetical protein
MHAWCHLPIISAVAICAYAIITNQSHFMNLKNKRSLQIGVVLAGYLIILFRCHAVDGWQPNGDHDFDKNTLWGSETNHVKAGLLLEYAPDTNRTLVGFYPVLNNSSATNGNIRPDVLQLWLPPFDSRYRMELIDTNGNAVLKTAKGKVLGKPIDKPFKHYRGGISEGVNIAGGYRGRPLLPNVLEDVPSDPFVLEDYFNITKAGKYHLTFEMRVMWFTSGWEGSLGESNLPTVWLPPVNAEIKIEKP